MTPHPESQMLKDIAFLREAAGFFEHADAMGEDRAFWANTYNAEACRRIADRLSALSASQEAAAPSEEPVAWVFGEGKLVIDTGTAHGMPAVFIAPATYPGEVGSSAAREKHDLHSLQPGEIVLAFPTDEHARAVADALVASPAVAPVAPVPSDAGDVPENTADNPKSWIAWKRKADELQATIDDMWTQFDRLRDATNRPKCGQPLMVGGHHISPWGIVDHAISALDLSMMRADRIDHEQKRVARAEAALVDERTRIISDLNPDGPAALQEAVRQADKIMTASKAEDQPSDALKLVLATGLGATR